MLLFIVSETFLFGSLFSSYFYLRAKSLLWPPEGVHFEMALVTFNTLILLSSSVTMQWAVMSAGKGDQKGLIKGLMGTMLLGTMFLIIKAVEWGRDVFRPWDHAYGSVYFTLTGFHALHVLLGLFILAALFIRARNQLFTSKRHLPVIVGGLYWHYVDAVWILVFATLFIIK